MTSSQSNNVSVKKTKIKVDLERELENISKEMYKRNLQLRETNKTLTLLRKVDEIILSSVTDIEEVAKKITEVVIEETAFKAVYIFSINKKERLLEPLARSITKSVLEIDTNFQRVIYSIKISLSEVDNPIVKVIKERKPQIVTNMFDIFRTYLNKDACKAIQKKINMNYFYIYPLIMRNELSGAILISTGEEKEPYLTYQRNLIERLPDIVAVAIDNAMLYQRIEHANIRLKELDKLKDEFVSIASHELRTPMTAIKSYLWMVLNKSPQPLDPQIKNYVQISYLEAERLIKLVQNMLTVSRIEGKRLEMNLEAVDINKLIKLIYESLKIKATEKKIKFEFGNYVQKYLVYGDKEKLDEVFENIIGNALKYTPENGSVFISIETRENTVSVRVSDTGPGISKTDMPKLFQKFSRLNQTKENRTPGTGLGLFISKQIVDLHKGTIKVDSEPGKGTTFTVTFPLSKLIKE